MKILAITQARIGSSRLPAKILKKIDDETLLEIHLKRILRSKRITKLKIATTTEAGTEAILEIGQKTGVEAYQGSLEDVLDRFLKTAETEKPDYVVRLTSDCPLIDPRIIDLVIDKCIDTNCDYVSNVLDPSFPDGLDVEVFRYSALEQAHREATLKSDREHVTPYIWRNSTFKGGTMFQSDNYKGEKDYSDYRITVDTAEDFELLKAIIQELGTEKPFEDYIEYLNTHRELLQLNSQFERNEGYEKSLLKD